MKLESKIKLLAGAALVLMAAACNEKNGGQNENADMVNDSIENAVEIADVAVEPTISSEEVSENNEIDDEAPVENGKRRAIFYDPPQWSSKTDTVIDDYRIVTIRRKSYEPEDYVGPENNFYNVDINGKTIYYDHYWYGYRGKVILSSIDGKAYKDSVYITRELIAEKTNFQDVKEYELMDFHIKGIRNDSIIIGGCLNIPDTAFGASFQLKFKKGAKAKDLDIELEVWDLDYDMD